MSIEKTTANDALEAIKIAAGQRDARGPTPLDVATDPKVRKMLLDACARPEGTPPQAVPDMEINKRLLDFGSNGGATTLEMSKNPEITRLLIEAGARDKKSSGPSLD